MSFDVTCENNTRKKILIYLGAFIFPAIMMLIVMIVLGIYPFGERSILVSDLDIQFVDYFSYLKTILTGNNDFIYTFSKNLGGDMVGFSAYYLQNPLLLLLAVFPVKWMPLGIMVIIILQVSLSGLSFSYFINQIYKPLYSSLLFSTAYAFMGFFFAYISLPIYFSNLALLPIVLLGLTRIVQNEKDWKLYVFSLAVYIFMNYYLGFMMCIFSTLYFGYLLLIQAGKLSEIRCYTKNIITFVVSSITAVLLIVFDLVMTALSLKGQKDGLLKENLSFYRQFRLLDLFSKLYTGSDKNHELPIIYCSVLAVVFLILYFVCKRYSIREKIYSACFLLLMMVCFQIHTLNVLWHGFQDPVGFAYRYAYFFSFLVLFLGYRGFVGLEYKIHFKQILTVGIIFIVYSLYLMVRRNGYVGGKDILINGVILFSVLICYWFLCKYNQKKSCVALLALMGVIQITDLTSNAVRAIRFYPENTMSSYSDTVERVGSVIDEIKEKDNGFYRLEKDFMKDVNDSMQYNYAGLSHSSSCEKDYVKAFIGKMGYRNNILWAYYHNGSTTFADCFLGVKYFISKFDSTDKPFTPIMQKNDCYVYENPYALPLAFCVTNQMEEVSMETDDLFDIQNRIASGFGLDEKMYIASDVIQVNTSNLEEKTVDGVTVYSRINPDEDAQIDYEVEANQEGILYFYFNAPHTQGADLFVDGDSYDKYFADTDWSIIKAGEHKPGDKVKVTLKLKEAELSVTNALFYQEKQEVLEQWYADTVNGQAELQKITSSHLKGTVNVPEGKEFLMFSIPYEKDWKIKIDGQPVSQIEVLDALMAVKVTPGSHSIDMQYVPRGFFPFIVISLITALVLMFIMINGKIKGTGCRRQERNYL